VTFGREEAARHVTTYMTFITGHREAYTASISDFEKAAKERTSLMSWNWSFRERQRKTESHWGPAKSFLRAEGLASLWPIASIVLFGEDDTSHAAAVVGLLGERRDTCYRANSLARFMILPNVNFNSGGGKGTAGLLPHGCLSSWRGRGHSIVN
jgi:hypothetical protein